MLVVILLALAKNSSIALVSLTVALEDDPVRASLHIWLNFIKSGLQDRKQRYRDALYHLWHLEPKAFIHKTIHLFNSLNSASKTLQLLQENEYGKIAIATDKLSVGVDSPNLTQPSSSILLISTSFGGGRSGWTR